MEPFGREFLSRQRLLVVSPHADDETAGAGGLMARVKEAGGKVFVMVASTGDLDHFDGAQKTTSRKTRSVELADAMKVLGVDDFEILFEKNEVHLRLETLPRRDLVDQIERKARLAMEKTKPTMIVLPAPSFNQDHEALYKAGITACRPHLATLKAFQSFVLVADAPQLAWSGPPHFRPNLYVDISGPFLTKKLDAYACHKSQIRPEPSQAGIEALRLLAEARGREISVAAAEAFDCYRFVV
ncbi:MAG: PIG-L family deacetylase [Planctomycetes bacterium]|nr:PIG-L family deacetylase [Planctomycetota bacterium]